jgi:hypothetical protein
VLLLRRAADPTVGRINIGHTNARPCSPTSIDPLRVPAAVTRNLGHGALVASRRPPIFPSRRRHDPRRVETTERQRGRQGNRNEVQGGSRSPHRDEIGTFIGTSIGTYATGGLGVHGLRCISVCSSAGSGSGLLLTPSLALGCRRCPNFAVSRLSGTVLHLEVWAW